MSKDAEETKYGFEDYADAQLDELIQATHSEIVRGPRYHVKGRPAYVVLRHRGKIRVLEYVYSRWQLRNRG